jgi:hypothetical protein
MDQLVMRGPCLHMLARGRCPGKAPSGRPARQALYLKQGRNAQFGSAEERDGWLRSEADALEQALAVKQASRGELEAQAQQAGAELRDLAQARASQRHVFTHRFSERRCCARGVHRLCRTAPFAATQCALGVSAVLV